MGKGGTYKKTLRHRDSGNQQATQEIPMRKAPRPPHLVYILARVMVCADCEGSFRLPSEESSDALRDHIPDKPLKRDSYGKQAMACRASN